MSARSKKKTVLPALIIATAALLITATILFIIFPTAKIQDTKRLTENTYNSLFISMYSIENYSEENFKEFRGLDTIVTTHTARNANELVAYLDLAFQSDNIIDTVYIGLDPYILYKSGATSEVAMAAELADLFEYIISYPDVTFEILLPAPRIDYWTGLNPEQSESATLAYRHAISCFEPHTNAICFFSGNEKWLIMNPNNYTGKITTNALISQKILLSSFCDRKFVINVSNADMLLNELRSIIATESTSPAEYPDLSDKTIVFFGDSILGLDYGSYSIPGVINGLTGADFYNYAIGGTTGCDADTTTDADHSFTDQMNKLISHADFYTGDHTQFPYDKVADDNLVFVINYGFNDYLHGYATEEFYQALEAEIALLKKEYPGAQIIIMVPHGNVYADAGVADPNKKGIFLSEYADIVRQLAKEQNLTLLDVPSIVVVDETTHSDYFKDGCHYNEQGRFQLAQHIISVIECN